MARVYTWQFRVRSYELDALRHVNNAVYQNYFEEAATQASAEAGFPYDWYFQHKRAWVIRRMLIRYIAPLRYGDEVELRTWVSDVHRIYSHREYDLRRADTGEPVARGRAKWVYVNLETMRPERIPPEMGEAFEPTGELEDLHVHLRGAEEFPESYRYQTERSVQRYELDPVGHVNNAVYLRWFEQAMWEAFERAGWPLERIMSSGLGMVQVGHDVDYLRQALEGMRLRIVSQPVALSHTRGVWQHEIVEASTGEVLTRDYSVGAFLDLATGRPCTLPDEIRKPLLNGPDGRGPVGSTD